MKEQKKWEKQAAEAEILECIQLDASSILGSALTPSGQLQIINGAQRVRRADKGKTGKEVPYGKNIIAG